MNDIIVSRPPVIILGGDTNSLSLTRSFGRNQVEVYIAAKRECPAGVSRYCTQFLMIPDNESSQDFWEKLLMGAAYPHLKGAVIFACDDEAVQFLARQRKQLSDDFVLDDFLPERHLDMLNKQKTLQLAEQAGCHVPKNWEIENSEELDKIIPQVPFPVMLKPLLSHEFQKHFYKKKYLLAENEAELQEKAALLFQHQLAFMLCEVIPGPDSNLCSYYTYLDPERVPLFHFTKRIVRRYPVNSGIGSAQVTEWIPETADMGQRFFNGIQFQGMGHVEFKRDPRDGLLKVIECNPRYSAAQEVITQSEIDMAYLVYQYLTGNRQPVQSRFRNHVRLWFPIQDTMAFWQMYRQGDISLWKWLKSIFHWQVFPVFSWHDPVPSIIRLKIQLLNKLNRKEV